MKFDDYIKPMKGIFSVTEYDAVSGEKLDQYKDTNVIVLDSRTAITRAISGNAGDHTIQQLKIGEDIGETMSGTPLVSFANANPDTITRSTGSWISDGFEAGDKITVRDTNFNNGEYTIDSLTATVLTLSGSDFLTAESNVSGAYITTGVVDTPSDPVNTYDENTMEVLYIVPDNLNVGYPDDESVQFSVTVNGADFMSGYPGETSKEYTSAALHTVNGNVFAYKRFPRRSISNLVNIVISWELTY